jgi:selenocysteine lyase/cysteine desulfurase
MTDRRAFVQHMFAAGIAAPMLNSSAFRHLSRATEIAGSSSPLSIAEDELYWAEIRRAFTLDDTLVNLNNGWSSPAPAIALEQMIRDMRFSNELPVEHMARILDPRIESVREGLAKEFGADSEEIAVTRNASESNLTVIFGLPLKRGDEVIVTTQNYGRMLNGWRQRVARDGIVLKEIRLDTPPKSDDDVVRAFEAAITPNTRAIEVMHISYMTGYIAPVRRIVDVARKHGDIPVLVDGAHAFAHFPFKRDELDCDYYGVSLHKWLHAPIGSGLLYVRRDKIGSVWPMYAQNAGQENNIRKYEEIGTHPVAIHNAVAVSLAFHRSIGSERKIARLRMLRDRWAKRLMAESDRVHLLTALGPNTNGAIATFNVDGLDMGKLNAWLWGTHRISTAGLNHPEFQGMRITPNVYTTLDEVDKFSDKVLQAIKKGIA